MSTEKGNCVSGTLILIFIPCENNKKSEISIIYYLEENRDLVENFSFPRSNVPSFWSEGGCGQPPPPAVPWSALVQAGSAFSLAGLPKCMGEGSDTNRDPAGTCSRRAVAMVRNCGGGGPERCLTARGLTPLRFRLPSKLLICQLCRSK